MKSIFSDGKLNLHKGQRNKKFPGSIPAFTKFWICVTFPYTKTDSAFYPYEAGKWVLASMES